MTNLLPQHVQPRDRWSSPVPTPQNYTTNEHPPSVSFHRDIENERSTHRKRSRWGYAQYHKSSYFLAPGHEIARLSLHYSSSRQSLATRYQTPFNKTLVLANNRSLSAGVFGVLCFGLIYHFHQLIPAQQPQQGERLLLTPRPFYSKYQNKVHHKKHHNKGQSSKGVKKKTNRYPRHMTGLNVRPIKVPQYHRMLQRCTSSRLTLLINISCDQLVANDRQRKIVTVVRAQASVKHETAGVDVMTVT